MQPVCPSCTSFAAGRDQSPGLFTPVAVTEPESFSISPPNTKARFHLAVAAGSPIFPEELDARSPANTYLAHWLPFTWSSGEQLRIRPEDGMSTLVIILLVLLLVGALPSWPYSSGWGYYPSGGLGLVLLIVLSLGLTGRL